MELIELLIQFGLTRQEAVIYIALCGQGSLTGYEAAKQTGISRSNTYTALAGLVEKGAANTIESNATHYVPVSAAEFCRNKLRNLEKSAQKLVSLIPEAQADADSYITIKGRLHVLDRAKNMIDGAAQRIYLSLSGECLLELLPHFEAAVLRGLKIVIITRSRITLPGAKLYRAYGAVSYTHLDVYKRQTLPRILASPCPP